MRCRPRRICLSKENAYEWMLGERWQMGDGGNLPGVTRTVSISIYDSVQSLDYASASRTSLLLLIVSFVILVSTYSLQRTVWIKPRH